VTGKISEDGVTLVMSLPEYAVLSNLLGLAVSVMQRNEEQVVVFMKELSSPSSEVFAKLLIDGFADITREYKGMGVREMLS
jgi:hypothetical protein